MNKKIKSIIIGVVVLVLLGGVLVFALNMPDNQENSSDDSQITYLIKEPPNGYLNKIKITNPDGSYTISYTGDQDGVQQFGIDENEGLNQLTEQLYSIATNKNSLATYFVVENQDQGLNAFGLNPPKATIEFEYNSKNKYKIEIGNISSDGTYYYAKMDNSDEIYAIQNTSLDFAFINKEAYISNQILEMFEFSDASTTPTMRGYKLYNSELPYDIILGELSAKDLEDNKTLQNPLKMTSPINSLISNDSAQKYIFDMFGLEANGIVKGLPTQKDLKKYGINDKSTKLEFSYNTKKYTFIIGNGIDNNLDNDETTTVFDQYNVYVPENKTIYSIETEKLKFMNLKAKDLISTIVVIPYIGDLESVEATINGKAYKFELSHENKEDGTLGKTSAKYNGKELDENNFKYLLQLMMDTPVEDVYFDKAIEKTPNVTIKYNYNNGKSSDTVEIIKTSIRNAVISINGEQKFTARAAYIDKLNKELINLIEGKDVSNEW